MFVSGRVQGVGFRHWTTREARALGIQGWVRNVSDGRVEALLEGTAEAVDEMLTKLHHGPRLAEVDEVAAQEEPFTGEYSAFLER